MKKLIIVLAVLAFYGCTKKDSTSPGGSGTGNVCASCKEAHSGYTPADYCGSVAAVDAYIQNLKTEGAKVGQSWSCTKH